MCGNTRNKIGKDQNQVQGMELPPIPALVCPSAAFPREGLWFAFVLSLVQHFQRPLSSSRGVLQQFLSTKAGGYPLT